MRRSETKCSPYRYGFAGAKPVIIAEIVSGMIFDSAKISEIHQRAILAGLHVNEKRSLLFFGVNGEYVASLPTKGNPSDQLLVPAFAGAGSTTHSPY